VLIPGGIARSFSISEQSGPKTVLGFCGAVLGIAASLTLGLAIVLSTTDHLALVAVVLAGFFVVFIGIVAWVLLSMKKDPTRLVVGPMTGREYLEYQRWTAGDDLVGERVETIISGAHGAILPAAMPALPPVDDQESER
jgi:hypothetical protein